MRNRGRKVIKIEIRGMAVISLETRGISVNRRKLKGHGIATGQNGNATG
jgi:hypothetical protein